MQEFPTITDAVEFLRGMFGGMLSSSAAHFIAWDLNRAETGGDEILLNVEQAGALARVFINA